MVVEREVLIERTDERFEGMKISWGGVFGGVLAGVGTLLLLSSLGVAIGVSAVDVRDPNAATIGTGTAIWTSLTLLIALFVGGWASTRLSMLWERTTAMFEGALVWVLSMIIILYLAASGIGLMATGALNMVSSTAVQSSGAAGQAAAEVRERADRILSQSGQSLSQAAARNQPRVSATAWVTFGALLLSLLAAIAGAAVGRRNVMRSVAPSSAP